MDEELCDAVDQRSRAQWEAAGRLDGHELVHRLRAQREIRNSPEDGEEDAPSGDGTGGASAGSTDEPLRRAVKDAVPEPERLPSGADENPISERVRDAAEGHQPPAERSTFQGGSEVAP